MLKFKAKQEATESGFIILECLEGKFKGIQWAYGETKFADKENDDGSINLTFDYDIMSEHKLNEEEKNEFSKELGDTLLNILEEQVKNSELVFSGGVD